MKALCLYNKPLKKGDKDDLDVLDQRDAVFNSLMKLGYEVLCLPVTLNLEAMIKYIHKIRPSLIFNLVESLDGRGQFLHFVPQVLDSLHYQYTGCKAEALYLTTNKLLTKEKLKSAGLPTPPWISLSEIDNKNLGMPCIIKPVGEDASIGLDDNAICFDSGSVQEMILEHSKSFGECFAESFVIGREFNLSVLDSPEGPCVLPAAEILFVDYPENKAKIVDYRAKWQEDSFEYQHTIRSFDFAEEDLPLIERLVEMARQCWNLFGLSGYARVDFRVDEKGDIWILEINANPCISPDSGFVAAAREAGIDYVQLIERIVDCALDYNY